MDQGCGVNTLFFSFFFFKFLVKLQDYVYDPLLDDAITGQLYIYIYMAKVHSMVPTQELAIKKKLVFIMGATGTGKTKLSIDLAQRFPAEIVNSDKIQVYRGLDVVTNKAPEAERRGVPHHLIGMIDPDEDFNTEEFCSHAMSAVRQITGQGLVPVIVGGSNTYIKALVEDPGIGLRLSYDCLFLWMDVAAPVLDGHVSRRVDEMVAKGLVDEVRDVFMHGADYTRGARRAIGVPEMDRYLSVENSTEVNAREKEALLERAIDEIKANTCNLAAAQREKITRLREQDGWEIHRIEATEALAKSGDEAKEAWEKLVLEPSLSLVGEFLSEYRYPSKDLSAAVGPNPSSRVVIPC